MAEPSLVAFESFGVPIVVAVTDPELVPRVERAFPPGWAPRDHAGADPTFALVEDQGSSYVVRYEHGAVSGSSDFDVAVDVLASQLRAYVALRAPGRIFVHAGVVAHGGRAIVIPGQSFSGKTTLVRELVREGATYLSDEYAVLDAAGLVHPFAKPLSLRSATSAEQVDHAVEALGGRAGDGAVPVGLVAVTRYRPGAAWEPRRLSRGDGVLALMENTVPAQDRPAESLAALRAAVDDAVVLEGERGEAAEAAAVLMAELAPGRAAGGSPGT